MGLSWSYWGISKSNVCSFEVISLKDNVENAGLSLLPSQSQIWQGLCFKYSGKNYTWDMMEQ